MAAPISPVLQAPSLTLAVPEPAVSPPRLDINESKTHLGFPSRRKAVFPRERERGQRGRAGIRVRPSARKLKAQADLICARHERLMRELALAQEVQRSMLPTRLPEVGRARVGAGLRPCEHLAGDFYGVVRLDRDHIGIYVGDVMGHGAAAALLGVYSMLRLNTKRIEGSNYELVPPCEALARLNEELIAAAFPGDPFVTMVYGLLNTQTLRLTYCNAGHPPPWLLSERPPHALDSHAPPLGIMEGPFEMSEIVLNPGDRLAFSTDGVDTLWWPGYGAKTEGLIKLLEANAATEPQTLVTHAIESARPIDGYADDVAVLLLHVV